jgi:uncharacterized protein YjdB
VKVREAAVGVELDITEADLKVGVDELQLTAIVEPSNSIDYDLVWTSSDEAVAVVSATGLVTPVGPGEAQITVTVDRAHQAVCVVRVTQPAEGVTLDYNFLLRNFLFMRSLFLGSHFDDLLKLDGHFFRVGLKFLVFTELCLDCR